MPNRYRATIWFIADATGAAERYAADLVGLWDNARHAGVQVTESQLAGEVSEFKVLSEPIQSRDQVLDRQERQRQA